MVNLKTPNKKRQSIANPGENKKSPNLNNSVKTPGRNANKGKPSPGKGVSPNLNKTPNQNKKNNANVNKTPKADKQEDKATPKTPITPNQKNSAPKLKQTPFPKKEISEKKNVKRSIENEDDAPPKKLQKFAGTSKLQKQDGDEASKKNAARKRGRFSLLRNKLMTGDEKALVQLENKIKALENRKELSKTAKKKLKVLHRLRRKMLGQKGENKPIPKQKSAENATAVKKEVGLKQKNKEKAAEVKSEKPKIKKEVASEEEDDESDASDYEVDDEIKPEKVIKTVDNEDDDEEEDESGEEEEEDEADQEDDDDSDEDEESEQEDIKLPKGKTDSSKPYIPNLQELKSNGIINNNKKTRYVVFVGNLPYDATKDEISEHFKVAGEIRHIRIPNDKQTNKPRGFAYVEFNDEVSYQKALSLHHSFLKKRRINVLYTQGGKKKGEEKKNQVKAKNLKLQAMRKQGQLAGSTKEKQKRSFRRAKKNAVNGSKS